MADQGRATSTRVLSDSTRRLLEKLALIREQMDTPKPGEMPLSESELFALHVRSQMTQAGEPMFGEDELKLAVIELLRQ